MAPLRRQSMLQEQMDVVIVAARQWRRTSKEREATPIDMHEQYSEYAVRLAAENMAFGGLVTAIDKLEEMSKAIDRTSTGVSAKTATTNRSPSHRKDKDRS